MNEILQQRIEEAAIELLSEFTEQVDLSEFAKEYLKKLFLEKAEWLLSHQWISVEEALPEFQQSVVVTNSEGDYWAAWRLNDNCEDTDDNGFVNNGIGEITHWMKIPSLEGGEE